VNRVVSLSQEPMRSCSCRMVDGMTGRHIKENLVIHDVLLEDFRSSPLGIGMSGEMAYVTTTRDSQLPCF